MSELNFDEKQKFGYHTAKIKVLGVGGAGSNMVNSMIDGGLENIGFVVANTDAQALKLSTAPNKIQLGIKSSKGLGAGANPEIGKRAAEEDLDKIVQSVADADVLFIAAGLGGGTGSGAVPVITKALKDKDILTIVITTKPFVFEGKRRMKIAEEALSLIKKDVDTIVVLPNQKLMDLAEEPVSLMQALSMTNDLLFQFVKSIADIVDKPGHINVDFADVKAIMKKRGLAVIGTGRASGGDRASKAALQAISSPLLENIEISGAQGVLINISGSSNLGLNEIGNAAMLISQKAHEDANIVFGSVIDDSLEDNITVTVIATGFYSGPSTIANTDIRDLDFNRDREEIKSQNVQEKSARTSDYSLDYNDLDVPTFVRKKVNEKHS